jgi:hypothetical protein
VQIQPVLAHGDERVRRSGIRALVALVEPGDPEISIKLALWLEAAAPVLDQPAAAGTHVCASHTATLSYCYSVILLCHTPTVSTLSYCYSAMRMRLSYCYTPVDTLVDTLVGVCYAYAPVVLLHSY